MHDRSDYKHGWQMDKEFEAGNYASSDEDKYVISEEDDLPHKCAICSQKFVNPVSTKCKHYFCEKCALDHYRKSQRCAKCGVQTGGTFNPAKDLVERMAKWAAEGREFKSDDDESDGDPERLPDESKPQVSGAEYDNRISSHLQKKKICLPPMAPYLYRWLP
jgi:RING finger protein 113A